MTAEAAADEQGGRVTGDHGQDREQSPHQSVRLRCVEEQVVVERHADVERAGEPHRPPAETLPASGDDQKGGESAHQREREHQCDVDLLEHRAAEREKHTKREEEPCGGARPHPVRQAEELPQREAAQDDDERVDAPDAGVDADQDQTEEDERAEDPDHERAWLRQRD